MLECLEHCRLTRRRRSGNYLGEQDRPSLGMQSGRVEETSLQMSFTAIRLQREDSA